MDGIERRSGFSRLVQSTSVELIDLHSLGDGDVVEGKVAHQQMAHCRATSQSLGRLTAIRKCSPTHGRLGVVGGCRATENAEEAKVHLLEPDVKCTCRLGATALPGQLLRALSFELVSTADAVDPVQGREGRQRRVGGNIVWVVIRTKSFLDVLKG